MKGARILSTGSYLPGEPITNHVIEQLVGPIDEDILSEIQVEQRHWLLDPTNGELRELPSDMAAKAAQQALELARLSPQDVDLIVTSTSSPDNALPPLATIVQEKLGLQRCAVIEVRSGCAGAIEALDIARLYLERGLYHTAVVIGSEAISPILAPAFYGKDPESIRVRDRLGIYTFGDGAGAIVLQSVDGPGDIQGSALACIGGDKKPGLQILYGGVSIPLTRLKNLPLRIQVDFGASGKFTPQFLAEALIDLFKRCDVKPEAIDVCIIPEGNTGYLQKELSRIGQLTPEWTALDGKISENLVLVGNTGSAALPLALDHAWKTERLQPGQQVVLLATEISKWIYAGMILTWSAPSCWSQRNR